MPLDPGITKKEVEGRSRKLLILWWKGRDSNPRPRHYEFKNAMFLNSKATKHILSIGV